MLVINRWILLLLMFIVISACVQGNLPIGTPGTTESTGRQATEEIKYTPPLPVATSTPIPINSTPAGSSGIIGSVTYGPTCPGPVRIGATECQDRPYQANITILDINNNEIISFLTDEQGFFQLPLKPGEYILRPESGKPFPTVSEQTVVVAEGQFTTVTIQYDSGMR